MFDDVIRTYIDSLLLISFDATLNKSDGTSFSLKVAQKNTSVSAISDVGLIKSSKMEFVIEKTQLGDNYISRHDVLLVEDTEYSIDSVVPLRVAGKTVSYEVVVNE